MKIEYVLIYLVAYILSYYSTRWIVKKEFGNWRWNDITIVAALSSVCLFLLPILGLIIIYAPKIRFDTTNPPPKWLIIIPVVLGSCSSPKWYMKPGTIQFKDGKRYFIQKGPARPVPDTVIHNAYILIRE